METVGSLVMYAECCIKRVLQDQQIHLFRPGGWIVICSDHQRPGTEQTRQCWRELRRVMGFPGVRRCDAGSWGVVVVMVESGGW